MPAMHPVKQNDDVLPQLSEIVIGFVPKGFAQLIPQEGKRVSQAASRWQGNLAFANLLLEGEVALDCDLDQSRCAIPGMVFRQLGTLLL